MPSEPHREATSSDARWTPGQTVEGFTVQRVTPLPHLHGDAIILRHDRTGARIIHVHNDDVENLFSISFRTPPDDDTGLPHILEHAVLAGSQRFPVKEPFFEMVKMSAATFINAMTGSDATYYPVCSTVEKDLFNLADVYFDAVFHPLLSEQTFRREGWHYAPADAEKPTGELAISGIVYNEMKGYFSDPEARLGRTVARELFPDTVYGKESGGEPDAIPQLTYDQFLKFHRRCYHPANAWFVFYGDIPTARHLAFLAARLEEFAPADPAPAVERQPRWTEPRTIDERYPVGEDEPTEGQTYLSLEWLCGDGADPDDALALNVLGLLLVGHEGAPLYRKLIDSHLGEDVVFAGASEFGIEAMFRVALKGSEPDRAQGFERLVLETLDEVAATPFSRQAIDAAMQQVAYRFLEIKSMFPIHVMDWIIRACEADRDPLDFLHMRERLESLKERVKSDPELFNRLLRERLVDNPHRVLAVLRPDPGLQGEQDARRQAKLAELRARMDDTEMRAIAEQAAELDRLNSQPNTPEQIASLPQLQVSDLPETPQLIPTEATRLTDRVELLRSDVPSNGVNYLAIDLHIPELDPAAWVDMQEFVEAFGGMGAAGMNYAETAQRRAAVTGGVSLGMRLDPAATDPTRPVLGLTLSTKALDDTFEQALDLIEDLLYRLDPRDKDRMRDLVIQRRAGLRTSLVQSGAPTAARHACRWFGDLHQLSHELDGLPQLQRIEALAKQFDDRFDSLVERVESVRDRVAHAAPLTASFIGTDAAHQRLEARLRKWSEGFTPAPAPAPAPGPNLLQPTEAAHFEGLAGPIQVAYCAKITPGPHLSDADEALVGVAAHIVRFDYILNEVRLKGNAYGAWLMASNTGGVIRFGSYRDPHVQRTLQVFDNTLDWIAQAQWSQSDVDRAVIALAKNETAPLRPAATTQRALSRHRLGITPEFWTERYQRIRAATPTGARDAITPYLEAGRERGAVCVVAGRDMLEHANTQRPERPLEIRDILQGS